MRIRANCDLYSKGDKVEVLWRDDGLYYPATVYGSTNAVGTYIHTSYLCSDNRVRSLTVRVQGLPNVNYEGREKETGVALDRVRYRATNHDKDNRGYDDQRHHPPLSPTSLLPSSSARGLATVTGA